MNAPDVLLRDVVILPPRMVGLRDRKISAAMATTDMFDVISPSSKNISDELFPTRSGRSVLLVLCGFGFDFVVGHSFE